MSDNAPSPRLQFLRGVRDGVPIGLGYFAVAFSLGITDEIFGLGIARRGWLEPLYLYGAFLFAVLCWASGTALGIVAGNILPVRAVSALSVAIYGMFLAVIIPPARENRTVCALVAVSFAASWLFSVLPAVQGISSGLKTILLTVSIAAAAALLFPVREEGGGAT